jgi:hypothetical protein
VCREVHVINFAKSTCDMHVINSQNQLVWIIFFRICCCLIVTVEGLILVEKLISNNYHRDITIEAKDLCRIITGALMKD